MKSETTLKAYKFFNLTVVLLKHLHRRREDGREELRIGLDSATIDVVHLAFLLRHALEVEGLCVAERQTSVGCEDEEVAHPGKFALEFVVAHELQFKFGERFTFTALASLQRHHLIRILWNFAHLIKLANPLVDFLVVALIGSFTNFSYLVAESVTRF